MKFAKTDLLEILWGDSEKYTEISDQIYDHSRWSVHHELIFQNLSNNKYYRSYYSVGATESQDETPYQYDEDEIECEEVFPIEQTITVYKTEKEIKS